MSYIIQALIGKMDALDKHVTEFQHLHIIALAQGMALVPLTNDLYDEIGSGNEIDHFQKLSPAVERWAMQMSCNSPIAYIEAEFFGGIGDQGSMVWYGNTRVAGPIYSQDAINQALRFLGVQTGSAHDEFAAVGLGQFRYTHHWIQ